MKKFSILCLLAFVALCGLTSCKEDPVAFNNIPILTLLEPSDLTRTSVTLRGTIETDYPEHVIEYGFLFSKTSDFSSDDTLVQTVFADSMDDVQCDFSGLEIGATYFYALYVDNGLCRLQSTVKSLTLLSRSPATISIPTIVDFYQPSLEAIITDDGDCEIERVGFCWSSSPNPTIYTGEYEFANYDEDRKMISADLTKMKEIGVCYICAFAECDISGSDDILISYGEVEAISLKHKVELLAVETTSTTLTFEITPFNTQQVKWFVATENNITAEEVHNKGLAADAENPSKIKVENLIPETIYFVYAVAEKEGKLNMSNSLKMATKPAPTVTIEAILQDYSSLIFSISSAHAEEVKYIKLTERDLKELGEITVDDIFEKGIDVEPNIRVEIKEGLEPEMYSYIYSVARSETVNSEIAVLKIFAETSPPNWRIYYTSIDGQIVEPYNKEGFGVKLLSNSYKDDLGVMIFDGEVTTIGSNAFYWVGNLSSIQIPDSVTSIGDSAFRDTNLTQVLLPNNLKTIGTAAFAHVPIENITIPVNVESIGSDAFFGCYSLTDITIPDRVKKIGSFAFSECSSLTTVTIGDDLASIGECAFNHCSRLNAFYGKYVSVDNRCIVIDGEIKAFAPWGIKEYTIPSEVVSIGERVFDENRQITSITIPEGVVSIGDFAFAHCEFLTNVFLPDSLLSISEGAFFNAGIVEIIMGHLQKCVY